MNLRRAFSVLEFRLILIVSPSMMRRITVPLVVVLGNAMALNAHSNATKLMERRSATVGKWQLVDNCSVGG